MLEFGTETLKNRKVIWVDVGCTVYSFVTGTLWGLKNLVIIVKTGYSKCLIYIGVMKES